MHNEIGCPSNNGPDRNKTMSIRNGHQGMLGCAVYEGAGKLTCRTCKVSCTSGRDLERHLKRTHNVRTSGLRCGICGKYFERLIQVSCHYPHCRKVRPLSAPQSLAGTTTEVGGNAERSTTGLPAAADRSGTEDSVAGNAGAERSADGCAEEISTAAEGSGPGSLTDWLTGADRTAADASPASTGGCGSRPTRSSEDVSAATKRIISCEHCKFACGTKMGLS